MNLASIFLQVKFRVDSAYEVHLYYRSLSSLVCFCFSCGNVVPKVVGFDEDLRSLAWTWQMSYLGGTHPHNVSLISKTEMGCSWNVNPFLGIKEKNFRIIWTWRKKNFRGNSSMDFLPDISEDGHFFALDVERCQMPVTSIFIDQSTRKWRPNGFSYAYYHLFYPHAGRQFKNMYFFSFYLTTT